MNELHPEVEAYVAEVVKRIPPAVAERGRIAADVRTHVLERVEAGEPIQEAIRRMGRPEEVARAYLAEIPLPLASVGRRTGAFMIDLGLGALLVLPLLLVVFGGMLPPLADVELLYTPWLLVGALFVMAASAMLLSVVYFPAAEALFGQTVGKRLLHICVTMESGEHLGWGAAIVRRLPMFLEFFLLDALFALFTRRRQRAFDLVAKTVVVRC